MDYFKESLKLHKKLWWKINTVSKYSLNTKEELSLGYTPWVAEPCREIAKDKSKVYDYTIKQDTVAVISDWSAVLWLWNIWPEAWLPVMEWKCILFKEFAGVNAFPIVLDTQDTEEIIKIVKAISPTFWWINLEDISAPRCFEIEERLKKELDIPVFHDDQHGTAIIVLAGIINSLKIIWKKKEELKVIINWVWAAWVSIAKLLKLYWVEDIIMVDTTGIIYKWREKLNSSKEMIANFTNEEWLKWWLKEAMQWRDLFIWVSAPWVLTEDMVKSMNKDPIIFAMANPTPEIMPDLAYKAWAKIVATWRSDFPNQLNNVLVFPWIFKWALKNRVPKITDEMKIKAAESLANYLKNPTVDEIIPSPLDRNVSNIIANAIK